MQPSHDEKSTPIKVSPDKAPLLRAWLRDRGGIAIWRSADLSDPSWSTFTPALDINRQPTRKPSWKAKDEPERVITDAREVLVVIPKELKRFRVALRRAGLQLKLSDASSLKLRRELAKLLGREGGAAWYEFDYDSQEAVIYVPAQTLTLIEFHDHITPAATEGGSL